MSFGAESRGDEAKRGMGTTLVIGTIIGNKLFVANIGDSRLYIVGGTEQIRQITRDHSLVDEMVRMGEMKCRRGESSSGQEYHHESCRGSEIMWRQISLRSSYVRMTGFFCVQTDLPIW